MEIIENANHKFDELIEKLYIRKDIVLLNGIPSGSNVLLQNFLDEPKKTDNTYQIIIMPKEVADGRD